MRPAAVKVMQGYMKMMGLTQEELATLLGTSPPQISKWINGRHNPCRAWQYRIASVCADVKKPAIPPMKRLSHEE